MFTTHIREKKKIHIYIESINQKYKGGKKKEKKRKYIYIKYKKKSTNHGFTIDNGYELN